MAAGDTVYSISWNVTRRCNAECAHCYLPASGSAAPRPELDTAECHRVVDEIAAVNPGVFLILTGGEPLLRPDVFDIAGHARERGFTVVLGTNGVILGEREARRMRERGVAGASISLDSTDENRHDAFRGLPGAWLGAVRATRILRDTGLDFSLHMSVMDWNVGEVPAMIDLARELSAKVLNLFFLVRTGRGRSLSDIDRDGYERVLLGLARAQLAAGGGVPAGPAADDAWSPAMARADGLLVRVKCAPHYRRLLYQLDPASRLLQDYAEGSCPAGKHYCRITPEGDVTPCPYMPVSAGSLTHASFGEVWRDSPLFTELRRPTLRGRCGACEYARICGGCRCRAYAGGGDYLAEDPACGWQPAGGAVVELPPALAFGLPASPELAWDDEARARLDVIPAFARGMVVRAVESYARGRGEHRVTTALMAEVRARWGGRFRAST